LRCEFPAANRESVANPDLRQKAVATAGNGFDKAGTFGGVAQSLSDFIDHFVEPVIEIHKGICGPEFLLKLLATYDFTGALKQHRQNLEGLLLKPNAYSVLA
jgi:hypothetical protein